MSLLSIEDAVKLVNMFGKQTDEQLAVARTIAEAVIADYGDFSPAEWAQVNKHGIWNDHASVQASLATLQLFAALVKAVKPFVYESERLIDTYGGDRPDHQYQPLMIQMDQVKELIRVYRGRKA
jgi:hypothetical protein